MLYFWYKLSVALVNLLFTFNIAIIFEMGTDGALHMSLNSKVPRVSRSEAIMTNFARALLTVLRQYKHKLLVISDACFFF
jgi:kinesin family protein 18/19